MNPEYKLVYAKRAHRRYVVSVAKKFIIEESIHKKIKDDLKKYADWFAASGDGKEEGDGRMAVYLKNNDLMEIQQIKNDKDYFWIFVGTMGGPQHGPDKLTDENNIKKERNPP